MDPPPVQFVTTSDGYSIAYATSGKGPPLVFLPFSFCHVQLAWSYPILRPWLEGLAENFRLVQYDPRGTGMSTHGLGPSHSMHDLQLDLEAVVSGLDLESFVLYGAAWGAKVAVDYAVAHPERVSALILCNGPTRAFRAPVLWYELPAQDWDTFLYSAIPRGIERAEADELVRFQKQAFNQQDFVTLMRALSHVSADDNLDALQSLRTQTLVLHARDFLAFSAEEAMKIAQQARGQMVLINGTSSVGDAEPGIRAIRSFLASLPGERSSPSSGVLEAILSTRELEVLRLIAAGKSNQQIADDLVLSVNTVARHVANILSKAAVANRTEAAAYARDKGLI